MRLSFLFAFLGSFWLVFAASSEAEFQKCGSRVTTEEAARIQQELSSANSTLRSEVNARVAPIPVYWHVIYSSPFGGTGSGNIAQQKIVDSIAAVNSHFAGSGISFYLAGTTRHWQAAWYSATINSPLANAMRTALHTGGSGTVNIYSTGMKDVLGYATMPWDYQKNPKLDGIVIRHTTVPGGSEPNFNQGKTLTHEIGHWVGLYHVFEGYSCTGIGDIVNDTPTQSTPSYGCPVGKDSCPNSPGVDSIRNYMDTTWDSCQNGFTAGQLANARFFLSGWRGVY